MIILAFEKSKVFPDGRVFQGFRGHCEEDYESSLIPYLVKMRRGDAEVSSFYKHPIPYVMVVNPSKREVFAYQRASDKDSAYEERLHGRWSWGIGGHVEPVDNESNPIRDTMMRELLEEVAIDGELGDIRVLGYINDERDEVGQVHFGILYLVETNGGVRPRDSEIAQGRFMSLSDIEKLCESEEEIVEGWSQIAEGPLRDYFDSRR